MIKSVSGPSLRGIVLPWLLMLALLGVELLLMRAHGGALASAVGLLMAAVVVLGPMRLRRAPPLARVFALAGAFWLLVLFGLGSLDPLTRHRPPEQFRSVP